jgi:hypothetical protein
MPGGRRRGVPHTALLFAPHTYNNPILYNDSTGHCPICLVAVAIILIIGISSDVPQPPPLPDPNQNTIINIRNSSTSSAEALVTMFTTDKLPGSTPISRLNVILNATKSSSYSHFAVPFDDSGFKSDFKDPYPGSSNQVGHFLTAVDISLNQNNVLGRSAIVGHEMYPDIGTPSGVSGFVDNIFQIGVGLTPPNDRNLFSTGTDSSFQQIINDGFGPNGIRTGNSIQDLRLSYLGTQMADKYISGGFPDNTSVGEWLTRNIMR